MNRCLITLVILLNVLWMRAQYSGDFILDSFTVLQVNNAVQLDFGIVGGASCQGAVLERSADKLTFETIAQIQGVCGGSEFVEFYTFIDANPLESVVSYYRLKLGNQGTTSTVDIHFVRLENLHRVFPNPAKESTTLRIENASNLDFTCFIYSSSGTLMQSLSGSSSDLLVDLTSYRSGRYLFQIIMTDSQKISGSFIVAE